MKKSFLNKVVLFLGAREKVLNDFKGRTFPIKVKITEPECDLAPETAPQPAPYPKVLNTPQIKRKISPLKLREKPLNEIKNEEKSIDNQIFNENFRYKPPSFLAKDLYEDNQIKNDRILKHLNNSLIDLKKLC